MAPDDKERRGGAKPGGKGGTDLDELKAKLGLARPGAREAAGAAGQQSAAEEFKFSFGARQDGPTLSDAELAAIEAEARKAATPLGRKVGITVALVVIALVLVWLGYQFGVSMGMRVLHNSAVDQAQHIRSFFSSGVTDAAGRQMASRKDATARFVQSFDTYFEEHFNTLSVLTKVLSEGRIPPDFDIEKVKKQELDPLKNICKEFLTNVEEYSVVGVLQGQLYSTELGARLLEFADKANKLRTRVESLYIAIELIESYTLTGDMPKNLKPEALVVANKPEAEADQLHPVLEVEVAGNPEVDKELITKEVCEPVAVELEIPVCGAANGEPEVEKRLIDTFDKRETQVVKQFRKIKVKDDSGKTITAKFEHLFKVDLRKHLMPLVERIGTDKKAEAENLGLLFSTLFQNLSDVKQAGEGVSFDDVLDTIEKFAGQDTFFTF